MLSRIIDEGTSAAAAAALASASASASAETRDDREANIAPRRPLSVERVQEEGMLWDLLVAASGNSGWLQPFRQNANATVTANALADAKSSGISSVGSKASAYLYHGSSIASTGTSTGSGAAEDEVESDLEELELENRGLRESGVGREEKARQGSADMV